MIVLVPPRLAYWLDEVFNRALGGWELAVLAGLYLGGLVSWALFMPERFREALWRTSWPL